MDSGVVLFSGLRGCGKTHRIREYVVRLVARGRTVVCFDVSGDISAGLEKHYSGRREGVGHFLKRYGTVAEYVKHRDRPGPLDGKMPIIACIVPEAPKTFRAEGSAFRNEMLLHAKKGWVWVSDESELIFVDWGINSDVFPLVTLSRNFGTLLLVACKDPVRLSPDIRRGSDAALIFALKTKESVTALRDIVDPAMIAGALRLKKREFLYVPPTTEDEFRSTVLRLGPDDDLPDEL